MEIRVIGTTAEINLAIEALRHYLNVRQVSRTHTSRSEQSQRRVYLEAQPKQETR